MAETLKGSGPPPHWRRLLLLVGLLLFGPGTSDRLRRATAAAKKKPNLSSLPLGRLQGRAPSSRGAGIPLPVPAHQGGAMASGRTGPGSTRRRHLQPLRQADGGRQQPRPNATFKAKVKKAVLKLVGNGLPTNHGTGNFPIRQTDDAFQYDRNPGTVTAQSLFYKLTAGRGARRPQCIGGMVGVARTGPDLQCARCDQSRRRRLRDPGRLLRASADAGAVPLPRPPGLHPLRLREAALDADRLGLRRLPDLRPDREQGPLHAPLRPGRVPRAHSRSSTKAGSRSSSTTTPPTSSPTPSAATAASPSPPAPRAQPLAAMKSRPEVTRV